MFPCTAKRTEIVSFPIICCDSWPENDFKAKLEFKWNKEGSLFGLKCSPHSPIQIKLICTM